jgi:hypothetical protein
MSRKPTLDLTDDLRAIQQAAADYRAAVARPVLAFNTGRMYSPAGQRIAATKLDDGRVVFVDIDRNLAYVILGEPELTQFDVMYAYDRNMGADVYIAMPDAIERERVLSQLRAAAENVRTWQAARWVRS